MGALLRLPPRVALVLIAAALAFVVYHIVTTERIQPLFIGALLVLGFALVRTVLRLRGAQHAGPRDQHASVANSPAEPAVARLTTVPSTMLPAVPPPRDTDSPLPAIELHGVSKAFGPVHALQDVSFTVPQGQVVALLGPNGAGKTTAISLMLGLRRPSQGHVRLLGRDPHDRHARSRCGIMLQESGVPLTLTVRETITLFRSYYPQPLPLAQILQMAGLEEKVRAQVGALSGGQRQRLFFALAVCGDPEVLFLDEPTAGLDVEARHSFWEQMRAFVRQGKTILLTTHYLEEADALAERVIFIDHGQVRADDSPAALKALVSHSRVSFDASPPLPPAFFAQLPLQQFEVEGRHVTLLTPQLETVLRALFTQSVEITGLAVSGASLEEAFFHLTHAMSIPSAPSIPSMPPAASISPAQSA